MSTPKGLSYWETPRESIACTYKNNDIAYATSGMHAAATVLKYLNVSFGELQNSTILDFGCGTGRVARPLSFFFKRVIAYDPVQSCIDTAKTECKVSTPNIRYTSVLPTGDICDFCCAVNVLEHLSQEDQTNALNLIKRNVKPQGRIVLWYSPDDNYKAIQEAFPEQKVTRGKPGIYIDVFFNT